MDAGSPCGESPEEILDLQYGYINAGDYEAAYALFATRSKALIPPDQYRAFFEENAPYSITDYSFTSVDVRGETATVGVSFTLSDDEGQERATVTQELVCEAAWRVVMRDAQVAAFTEAGQETAPYEQVGSADVDGDGSLDEIALVGEPDEYDGERTQITVRVVLADGTTLTRQAELENWHSAAWLGATDFGKVPGEELVIGGTSGAHTLWYRVLTDRDGELVDLPYPDSDSYGGDTFYASLWPIDAAASVYMGVVCDTTASTVVLRSASLVGAPSEDATFEGEATSWVLEGGQWRMVGSSKLEYPDAASASDIAGWQCGDLPQVYD